MPADHILATKLVAPAVPMQMVNRARLPLPDATQRLILVCAPAGYGKTTLLASWADTMTCPVSWLSLDDGDNDATRFLMHFITAIQTRFPEVGKVVLEMLECTPPAPVAGLMRTLINQLCTLPEKLCIILDDMHLVTEEVVHEAISFLIDHQPPQLQLILASRSDPPFSLARLRGQGQLLEYRAIDLRFTLQETEAFCNEVMRFNLPHGEVATLALRTEGWIVGLQLAAVSLRNASDKSSFIETFAGDNRHITDFLLDEVLSSRSPAVQEFLLQTSLLDRFNASLCDAVTGRSDSRALIDEIERANMFIVGLDHQRNWYRYHHLFTSLLQHRLTSTQPGLVTMIHQRACQWFCANGLISEAVNHAIKAKDFAFAADLMEQHGGKLFSHGQISTVLTWADLLPKSLLLERPGLSMLCAWGSFYMDNLPLLGRHIKTVAKAMPGYESAAYGSKERTMYGQLAIMRGCQAGYSGQLDQAIEHFKEATASIPPERTLYRAAAVCLGVQYFVSGDLNDAEALLEEHSSIAQVRFNVMVPITAVLGLGRLHMLRGNLSAAQQVYLKAMRECTIAGWDDFPACGMLHIGMGELAYEMNDLTLAEKHLNRGIEMTAVGMQYVNTWARILLAQTRLAQGITQDILPAQCDALLIKYAGRFVTDVPPVSAAIGRLWLMQNNSLARQWSEAARLPVAEDLVKGREPEYLVMARYLLSTHQPTQALALLDKLWELTAPTGRLRFMIEIQLLKTLALHMNGDTAIALSTLQEAISQAAQTSLVRVFLNDGPSLAPLLKKIVRGSEHTAYVHSLLAQMTTVADPEQSDAGSTLPQLFSKKETQVVNFIAKGSSNQEIAEALFISANTVNSHLKSIYSKLGVNSRLQAVERLRKLGWAG